MDSWLSFSPLVVIGLQAACAVHALKTGRSYYWLWIILFFPGLGCLVYFLVEILPDLRMRGGPVRVGPSFLTLFHRGPSIRDLEEQLEIADTFKNRQQLARAYVAAGRLDEAIQNYRRCLDGFYKDDPQTMLELCRTFYDKASYAEARETLLQLQAAHSGYRPPERDLLLARTLEALGETPKALETYASASKQYPGEEARCRYAMLLQETGETRKAQEIFAQILRTARRSPRYYRRIQGPWIAVAKRNIAR